MAVTGDADDERAFSAFVGAEGDHLLRTAFLLTGNWASAEDLLQSALLKTWRRWTALHDQDAAGAYVVRCMTHLAGAWWRRRWTGERPTAELPEPAAPDSYDALDTSRVVLDALARLSARQRAVLVLRFSCDLPETEVARILGCSVGTVKSTSSRALAVLRAADVWDGLRPALAAGRSSA